MADLPFVIVRREANERMLNAGAAQNVDMDREREIWIAMSSNSPSPVSLEEIVEVLLDMCGAKITADAVDVADGWDGPEKQYGRHPCELGAQIPTTCGAVYELRDTVMRARSLLSRLKGMDNPEGKQ